MNWKILQLDVKPAEGKLEKVVLCAHWELTQQEDGYEGRIYGACSFAPPSDDFTPYEDLTKEQVLGWLWESVNKEDVEASVLAQIETQKNPPIITPNLPWNE